jgi:hypothetical protein
VKPRSTSCSAASTNSIASGSSVRSSAITSSFTQSVSSASRPSCAVSTASRAVKHPAVFGRTCTPARFNTSITEPSACASTRRIATVVSSVPDAISARSRTSRLGAPPVPMMSREENARPAITSGSSTVSLPARR